MDHKLLCRSKNNLNFLRGREGGKSSPKTISPPLCKYVHKLQHPYSNLPPRVGEKYHFEERTHKKVEA